MLAVIVFVVIAGGGWLAKRILSENELRLELLLVLSVIVGVMGLITTSNGKTIYVANTQRLDFKYVLISLSVLVLCLVCGYFLYRLKKFKIK